MTWKEFVDTVNRKMHNQNIPQDIELWYVDISGFGMDDYENLIVHTEQFKDCKQMSISI